jgi:hypothetical protein
MRGAYLSIFLILASFLAACAQQTVTQPLPVPSSPEVEETVVEPAVQETTAPEQEEIAEPPVQQPVKQFTIEGDDDGLYPNSITVNKGDKVRITFKVRSSNVYYGGLDFRAGPWGDTGKILPGGSTVVEFTAVETFQFKSYWPASNRLKATGNVIVR